MIDATAQRGVEPRPPHRGGRRLQRRLDSRSGQFTQPDPIGLAGGLNLYGYAGGDPVNNHDPFGTKVILRFKDSTAAQDAIDYAVENDTAFARLWKGMVDDTATYALFDDPTATSDFAMTIHTGGFERGWSAVADFSRTEGYGVLLRGYSHIPTAPGSDPLKCTIPHAVTHLSGVFNGGTQPPGNGDPLFRRPYFDREKCGGHR